jgi:hypothetical protein
MRRLCELAVWSFSLIGCATTAMADNEVRMVGDARIHANFWSNIDYTGWNNNGTKAAEDAVLWERFRLRTDFIANKGLKFRLGIRIQNRIWATTPSRWTTRSRS